MEALSSLKVVVDHTIARDELRVHPAMFARLKLAFHEADCMRAIPRVNAVCALTLDPSPEHCQLCGASEANGMKCGKP